MSPRCSGDHEDRPESFEPRCNRANRFVGRRTDFWALVASRGVLPLEGRIRIRVFSVGRADGGLKAVVVSKESVPRILEQNGRDQPERFSIVLDTRYERRSLSLASKLLETEVLVGQLSSAEESVGQLR